MTEATDWTVELKLQETQIASMFEEQDRLQAGLDVAHAEIERLKEELAWSVKTALTLRTELDEWRRVSVQKQQQWDEIRQQLLNVSAVIRKYESADVSPTPAQQAILDDLRYVLKRQ